MAKRAEPLARVVAAAQQLARISDGAFDVTVGPLVNVWGFGPGGGKRGAIPSQEAIAEARSRIGYPLSASASGLRRRLRKTHDIYVDLSAIAQGYTAERSANCSTATDVRKLSGRGRRRGARRPRKRRTARVGTSAIEAPDGDATTDGSWNC